MSKPNIMIIFWGNPLYDGRCVNMINQLLRENLIVKVIGVDSKNDTLNFNGAEASEDRRVARRTSRRTASRQSCGSSWC